MTNTNDNAIAADTSKKSMDFARKELSAILDKMEDLRLPIKAWRMLRARSRLRPTKLIKVRTRHLWLLLLIATWIVVQVAWTYVLAYRHSKCWITTPSFVQKLFRPPQDCSICQDIQQVDKLSAVDPTIFEQRYAYSGKPVVISDAMANWTAPTVFSFSFFKTLYHGEEANCQFFPYKTEFRSLQDVFDMSADRAMMEKGTTPWYVGWSNCDERIGVILREHYQRPYFLPATAESKKTDWIFMGSNGYGAPMHVDDVDYPSWQAQIKGEKLWILDPPRECHYTCKRLEVIVHTGEIIVLDTNRWYHQTKIISDDMSITIGAEYD
ncbi:JMJD4 protein, partial [Acromyrmex heyeri]